MTLAREIEEIRISLRRIEETVIQHSNHISTIQAMVKETRSSLGKLENRFYSLLITLLTFTLGIFFKIFLF